MRTAELLHQTARELLREGLPLTVQALADRSGVSRATAYRYFGSNEEVMLKASLPLLADPLEDAAWNFATKGLSDSMSLPDRAAALVLAAGQWAFSHEAELRTVLAISLEPSRKRHGLRRHRNLSRTKWIDSLLAELPESIGDDARARLGDALVPLFGADAIFWLTDSAGLTAEAGLELLQWMAKALVQATLQTSEPVDGQHR